MPDAVLLDCKNKLIKLINIKIIALKTQSSNNHLIRTFSIKTNTIKN